MFFVRFIKIDNIAILAGKPLNKRLFRGSLVYGLILGSRPMVITNAITLLLALAILYMTVK